MVDAMLLLERIAMKGVKFPGSLIMLSKVMFTLDGILRDIGGSETGMSLAIVRHLTQHWISDRKAVPLASDDERLDHAAMQRVALSQPACGCVTKRRYWIVCCRPLRPLHSHRPDHQTGRHRPNLCLRRVG